MKSLSNRVLRYTGCWAIVSWLIPHHQGVQDSGKLKVTGRASHDGLIESVVYEHLKFFHGLQWHPERINQYQMYAALVNAARSS